MSAAQPVMRLVRDDDAPRFNEPVDTLSQLQAMRNEVAVLNAEISVLRRDQETRNVHLSQLSEELKLAARLQQDFLPKSLPRLGPVRFHQLFRPAGYVSGDFYDVIRLDEKHIGFYIADAVGHGVPAALLTMFIKHAVVTKQIGLGGYRLLTAGETMQKLNDRLVEQDLSAATFATAIYGAINIETLSLNFARAGHPHPLLVHKNGEVETIKSDGGLLGIFPDATFIEQTVQLTPGDKLVIFTDGIEVLFAEDVQDQHRERWREELLARRNLGGEAMLREFGEIIDRECAGREQKDDVTMLVVEVG